MRFTISGETSPRKFPAVGAASADQTGLDVKANEEVLLHLLPLTQIMANMDLNPEGHQALEFLQSWQQVLTVLNSSKPGYIDWYTEVCRSVERITGKSKTQVVLMVDQDCAREAYDARLTVDEYVDAVLLDNGYDRDGTYYGDQEAFDNWFSQVQERLGPELQGWINQDAARLAFDAGRTVDQAVAQVREDYQGADPTQGLLEDPDVSSMEFELMDPWDQGQHTQDEA